MLLLAMPLESLLSLKHLRTKLADEIALRYDILKNVCVLRVLFLVELHDLLLHTLNCIDHRFRIVLRPIEERLAIHPTHSAAA